MRIVQFGPIRPHYLDVLTRGPLNPFVPGKPAGPLRLQSYLAVVEAPEPMVLDAGAVARMLEVLR